MYFYAFAQDGIGNPVAPNFNFGELITGSIGFIIIIAFIVAFFFLIWGGFQWIASGGAPDAVESARNRIVHALIGLTIVVAAWAIMGLIGVIFDIEFTALPFPKLGSSQENRQCYATNTACLQSCAPGKIEDCFNRCGNNQDCWENQCGLTNSLVCFDRCKNGPGQDCIECIKDEMNTIIADFCQQSCGDDGSGWQCK